MYEKEISPGYVVKLTVTELKPFHSTEIYRNRVAGTQYENSYDPDAKTHGLDTCLRTIIDKLKKAILHDQKSLVLL